LILPYPHILPWGFIILYINPMTESQTRIIKEKIEEINNLYSPIVLHFDAAYIKKVEQEDNWFVTIIHLITEEDWIQFTSLEFNYHTVIDKLNGWADALEATKEYINIYGTLKINPNTEENVI